MSDSKKKHSLVPEDYLPLFVRSETNNQEAELPEERPVSNLRRALPQILAVSAQNLLQFGYGMTQGFPTIAIPAIQSSIDSPFTLTEEQISWLSSINLICMPVGCLCSGMFAQLFGKRRGMQLINFPILLAWMFFYYATCTEHMYVALCLIGLASGLMEAPVITYVAEITDPTYRGMFSALATTCVSMGVFTQFALGTLMHWRTVALVSTVVPIFSVVALCFIPESPVWLIREKRFIDAIKALQWLRGWVPAHKVEAEFKQLYDELIIQKSDRNATESKQAPSLGQSLKKKLHMWQKRSFVAPFLLVLLTFFICHFSGKTPLRTYAVVIFDTLRTPMDKYHATILLGISEFLATIVGAALIHSTGKRPLVLSSMLGTGVCILGIAIYAHSFDLTELTGLAAENDSLSAAAHLLNDSIASTQNSSTLTNFSSTTESFISSAPAQGLGFLSWLPLILVLGAAFSANLGVRMIPWVLIGEVFPADIRNSASGFSGCMGYIFGFLANKMFLLMVSMMTFPGTFAFYASVSIMGIVVLYFILPETEGCTLGEIEAHFSKKSDVNLLSRRPKQHKNNKNQELEVLHKHEGKVYRETVLSEEIKN